jgi:hypothetical protein
MTPSLKSAYRLIAVASLIFGTFGFGESRPRLPAAGVVPDEQTAVKIAEAIFPPVFGAAEVGKWQPYHAQLDKDGVWTVYGTLPSGFHGGTPMLKISKRDGRVLEVWHSM